MRIIVTEHGGQLIKSLGIERNLEKIQNKQSQENAPTIKLNESTDCDISQKATKNNAISKILENSKNIKVIDIKPKKISIPKDIADKYNEMKIEESSLLPILHQRINKNIESKHSPNNNKFANNLIRDSDDNTSNVINTKSNNNVDTLNTEASMKLPISININSDQEADYLKTSYMMKEIINNTALDQIKSNIIYDVKMKNKLTNVMQTNFRSPFLSSEDKLFDFQTALNKKIKSDKSNIIQYINSKNCLSPKFINSLCNYDEEKIVRLNKICQRVLNQDGKDNDLKSKINGIIDNMHVYQQAEYKRQMGLMEKEVNSIKMICERYPKRDDREKYENILHDIKKKYWSKINVDRTKKILKTEN